MFIFNNLSISSTLLSVLLLLLALVVLLEVLLAFILDPTSASKLLKSGMAPLSNPKVVRFVKQNCVSLVAVWQCLENCHDFVDSILQNVGIICQYHFIIPFGILSLLSPLIGLKTPCNL